MSDESPKFAIYEDTQVTTNKSIWLYDDIESNIGAYTDLLDHLSSSDNNTNITLNLGNVGGDCEVGFALAFAFKNCGNRVNVVVHKPCYSMSAILALSGDSLLLQNNAYLMFHNYSVEGGYGKGRELMGKHLEFDIYFQQCFESICKPFLTQHECNTLYKDNDLYIRATDKNYIDRLKRHYK